MYLTTPRVISDVIMELCRELVNNPKPRFMQVTPVEHAGANDCFPVIEQHVQEYGGSICYGWQIWEWPGEMVQAEFHAVWRDSDGELHDLTPKQVPVDRILFLPDPEEVYEVTLINNVRRALSTGSDVEAFIKALDHEYEFMNRGARINQHGEIILEGPDAREWSAIQQRKSDAQARIIARQPKPGRNDPCPCGSGKKFKKCHGR